MGRALLLCSTFGPTPFVAEQILCCDWLNRRGPALEARQAWPLQDRDVALYRHARHLILEHFQLNKG